ncbi:Type II secretion system protein G precursor [compost metagenome]
MVFVGKLISAHTAQPIRQRGFTIVELLIVIVIIGILAAITIVAYNGIQQRASTAAMHSDLAAATKQMELARVDSTNETFPTSLPSGVKSSQGVVLQLAQTSSNQSFCVNAYRSSPYAVASFDSTANSIRPYLCSGATIGSAVGGSVPSTPRGVNLATDLSTWTTTGGISYNSTTKEISFSGSGDMTSPLIRIDEPTSATLQVESYTTTSAPSHTPNSGVYFTSYYFGANGSSPATNSIGYTSNGNAQMTPLSSWTQRSWNTSAGPGVVYIKFVIRSSPSNYTSDNKIRNVSVVAN